MLNSLGRAAVRGCDHLLNHFTHVRGAFMDELANEGSAVSDYHFPRLGIIGGFNYPSLRSPPIVQVAREVLSGGS